MQLQRLFIYFSQDIYFTECSGTVGSDWWSDIKVCGLNDVRNLAHNNDAVVYG